MVGELRSKPHYYLADVVFLENNRRVHSLLRHLVYPRLAWASVWGRPRVLPETVMYDVACMNIPELRNDAIYIVDIET